MGWSLKIITPGFRRFKKGIEASVTGDSIQQSEYSMKHNHDLLQVAEVVNDDTYLTANASKINEDNDDMIISVKNSRTMWNIKKL